MVLVREVRLVVWIGLVGGERGILVLMLSVMIEKGGGHVRHSLMVGVDVFRTHGPDIPAAFVGAR